MDSIALLYCPCPDMDCARDLARKLLDQQLIACANILPQMTAIYRWQGHIEENSECVLLLKTAATHTQDVEAFLSQAHPYDVPCILHINEVGCNSSFAQWLNESC